MAFNSDVSWANRAAKAILLIRILVGWVFLSEGVQKFLFPDALGVGRFIKIGIPWPLPRTTLAASVPEDAHNSALRLLTAGPYSRVYPFNTCERRFTSARPRRWPVSAWTRSAFIKNSDSLRGRVTARAGIACSTENRFTKSNLCGMPGAGVLSDRCPGIAGVLGGSITLV